MTLPVIILGAGGHARVLIDALLRLSVEIVGLTDADPGRRDDVVDGIRVIGTDEAALDRPPDTVRLVNGVGSIGDAGPRRRLFETFKGRGYTFADIAHPAAIIAGGIAIGEGSQVMAGAILQPGCRVGTNAIINTGAVIDHDCAIGDHVHVAPGAALSGGVAVGDGAHIGIGASVIQNIEIGADAVIGAGAAVIENVAPGTTVAGVPAREL